MVSAPSAIVRLCVSPLADAGDLLCITAPTAVNNGAFVGLGLAEGVEVGVALAVGGGGSVGVGVDFGFGLGAVLSPIRPFSNARIFSGYFSHAAAGAMAVACVAVPPAFQET